jgi:hypothetical protein
VQGYGWLARLRQLSLFGEHLNNEEVLAVLLVSLRENFITMKAFIILTSLGNLRR